MNELCTKFKGSIGFEGLKKSTTKLASQHTAAISALSRITQVHVLVLISRLVIVTTKETQNSKLFDSFTLPFFLSGAYFRSMRQRLGRSAYLRSFSHDARLRPDATFPF